MTATTDWTIDDLIPHMEWREPARLCTSSGRDWAYQEPRDFVAQLQTSLAKQYDVWLKAVDSEVPERSMYNLIVGGAGSGKSRTLEHSKELLLSAAERIGDPVLVDRISSALVFHISFENPTTLLVNEGEYPEADVSLRMLYQLMKDPGPWEKFAKEMVRHGPFQCLSIEGLITMLTQLQGFHTERQLTIILCVDGIETVTNHKTSCGAKTILETLKGDSAFIVGVFATAEQNPMDRAMSRCGHDTLYLRLPPLDGFAICHSRTRLERQLISAMDGHGRALEVVKNMQNRFSQQQFVDDAVVYREVCDGMRAKYPDLFASKLFQDQSECCAMMSDVLACSSRMLLDPFKGGTELVDVVQSRGLVRWVPLYPQAGFGRVECPFILLYMLLPTLLSESAFVLDRIALESGEFLRSLVAMNRLEVVVALQQRIKSIVFQEGMMPYTSHQAGAVLSGLERSSIMETGHREVVAVSDRCQSRPSKKQRAKMLVCSTTQTVSTLVDCSPNRVIHHRVEIIQCMGLLPASETKVTTAVIQEARAAYCAKVSDILVVVVKAEPADDLTVPVNCGVVTTKNWRGFFGPFACLADQCLEAQLSPTAAGSGSRTGSRQHEPLSMLAPDLSSKIISVSLDSDELMAAVAYDPVDEGAHQRLKRPALESFEFTMMKRQRVVKPQRYDQPPWTRNLMA